MTEKRDSNGRCTGQGSTAVDQPRAHTTGTRANGRGGPGAYERIVGQPPAPVKSPPGGRSDLDVPMQLHPSGWASIRDARMMVESTDSSGMDGIRKSVWQFTEPEVVSKSFCGTRPNADKRRPTAETQNA